MLRRTKIIATIGPASSKYKILEGMVAAGMNLARINFSHGNKKEYIEIIKMLREISLKCDSHIGIIADLQGPKIRIKSFQKNVIFLNNSKDPQNIENLQRKVWGHNSNLETHTVETHIYRLRKKIKEIFNDNNFLLSKKDGYTIN